MNFDISAWRSRVCDSDLARPGQAFALPLRNTTVRYFQGLVPLTASVYRPGFVGIARQGTADVRIRKVFPPNGEGIALEGTIRSAERLSSNENDLLSIHLPLSEGNADLLGHLDFTQARSEGEAVFRTIPQTFSPALTAALPFIEGSAYSRMAFDTLSPLRTPFDLYFAEPNAGEATLPPRLWWATLAFVLRLFPKLLPESFRKGYGDAPPLALETVFDEPVRELDALLLRWRAFLLGSWRQNQEVARVIGS